MKKSFDEIKNEPNQKRLVQLAEAKYGTPLPENIQNLIIEGYYRSSERVSDIDRWVKILQSTTSNIVNEIAEDTEYPLFWIYLYGVVYEIEQDFEDHKTQVGLPGFLQAIYDNLKSILECFDTEELGFIKFMRNKHVHVFLDYYWSRVKQKDGMIVSIKTPGEADAPEIAQRIIEGYGTQNEVAKSFAERILMILDELGSLVIEAQKPA